MKNRVFNENTDSFLVFFTVSTALDFNLDVEEELRRAFREAGIAIPKNFQEMINNAV